MTAAAELTDTDLAHLAAMFTPPVCEVEVDGVPCETEASWLLVVSCGCTVYYCDEHREVTDMFFAAHGGRGNCEDHGPRIRVIRFVAWRPVR